MLGVGVGAGVAVLPSGVNSSPPAASGLLVGGLETESEPKLGLLSPFPKPLPAPQVGLLALLALALAYPDTSYCFALLLLLELDNLRLRLYSSLGKAILWLDKPVDNSARALSAAAEVWSLSCSTKRIEIMATPQEVGDFFRLLW